MTRPMWPALFDALVGVTTVRAAVVEEKRALTHLDALVATLLQGVTRCTNLQALRAQICSKQPCVKPASEVEATRTEDRSREDRVPATPAACQLRKRTR